MESCCVSAEYYFYRVALPTEVSDPENLNLGLASKLIAYTLIKPQTPMLNGQEMSS
jgi:hypothetical protein